ncbi:MAG: ClpXP protease specificity-enhancing factor SspB [Alphaproteobacteria bacterium]|nr:ClpXP protease specificity-enhancing factor SspB [Alphaproteobacteria bacterium]
MADTPLHYEQMVDNAMRAVVRDALQEVAENGLPGDHHFFISFKTDAPEVEMPAHLRAQHPNDITVVIQHQFWNLLVDDVGFSVDLAFGGKRQHLYIPFASLISFVDPSVEFGLQFAREAAAALAPPDQDPLLPAPEGGPTAERADQGAAENDAPPAAPDGGENVVSLDRFRKK